jgi:hypothetical protein
MPSIEYSWEITGVKVKDDGGNKDTIVQVNWKKIGKTIDGKTGVFVGSCLIPPVSTEEETDFISFKNIKEKTIIEWVEQIVSGAYEQHVNEVIENQIGTVPVEKTLPWVK